MSEKNGGPAFPRPQSENPYRGSDDAVDYAQEGMSIRDYFAGKALAGLMANPERYRQIAQCVALGMSQEDASAKNAHKAYLIADAMLAERAKP